MKKAYLLIIAAALAFAGCSKVGPEHSDPNAWMYDESLPVPIMVGTPGAETLTKVGFEDGGVLPNGTQIGVFGLEYGNQGWTSDEIWSESVIVDALNPATLDENGNITFNVAKYYPLNGGQNFNFYGFYPYTNVRSTNPDRHAKDSRFEAIYKVDGKTDILWAESVAPDLIYTNEKDGKQYLAHGYNAAYIRKILKYHSEKRAEYMPKLEFQHKLTLLKFKLRAYEDAWTELDARNVTVTGLKIVEACDSAKLVIANLVEDDETLKNGTLFSIDKNATAEFTVPQQNDVITLDSYTKEGTDELDGPYKEFEFDDGLLLIPSAEYKAKLSMTYTVEETNKEKECDINLIFSLPNQASFNAGTRYTLTIIVKAPQEVTATATLSDWEDHPDEIIFDQINGSEDELYEGE